MARPTSLLILGASVRASAFSALRAGFRPDCADRFADLDLASIGPVARIDPDRWPDDLARLAGARPSSPWLYTGPIENFPELIDRIAAARPLWGNPGSTVRAVRDPIALAETLHRAGLPCPAVREAPDGLPRDGSWLVKPLASAGGRGIAALLDRNPGPPESSYYQERIEGPSLAALYVGHRGGARLAGVTRQEIGHPSSAFGYAGSLGPWPVAPVVENRLTILGEALASAFGLLGLFGVDFILRDGWPWPVEVNPRYTASAEVLELALGVSLLAEHARIFSGWPKPSERNGRGFVGKRILFATGRGVFAPGRVPIGDPARFPRLGDIPWPGTAFEAGMPLMTVFASGSSPEACRRRLDRKAAGWMRRLSGPGATTS